MRVRKLVVLSGRPLLAVSMLSVVVGCLAGAWVQVASRPATTQPLTIERKPYDVVMITLCSVRADHMSCYGYERDTTPNLRRLAADSIVFEHAFTPWPKTTPGFSAIMSAKYGHHNGVLRVVRGQQLAAEHVTFNEVLKAHGYDSAAYLSSGALGRGAAVAQGFDERKMVWRNRGARDVLPATLALRWLRQRPGKRPFFVWSHFNNAHYKYQGGGAPDPDMFVDDEHYNASKRMREARTRYENPPVDVPRDHPYAAELLRSDIGMIHYAAKIRGRPGEYAFYVARYDAGVFGADHAIGKLLDGLRAQGRYDKSIIVVVGDHGESMGGHNYYFEHGRFPYDDTVRVPMMIRLPGGAYSQRFDPAVSTLSLAPTLLDLLGIEPPADWEGQSLLPALQGREPAGYVFTESGYHFDYTLTVRDDEWKLIHVPNPLDRAIQAGSEYELYQWREDPDERRNLVTERPEVAKRLKRVLHAWAEPWRDEAYGRAAKDAYEMDEELRRELIELGYIDPGGPTSRPSKTDRD